MQSEMISTLKKAPFALACWLGVAGGHRRRGVRILVAHGTPRRLARVLERQLSYLKRQFRIVALPQLVGAFEERAGGLDGMVALTFDDGLRNNVEVAYPILRRHGLPAAFFVCPGLIDERRWLWTHEARLRLRALGQDADPVVEWMKTLHTQPRQAVEEALRAETRRLQPSTAEREDFDLAGWDELRALDPALITIGSHTATHPILTGSDAIELETEVAQSRRTLEARLQRPVEYFCYPNGDHGPEVVDCARRHYRAALTDGGHRVPPHPDLHELPRLDVPSGALRLAARMHRTHA